MSGAATTPAPFARLNCSACGRGASCDVEGVLPRRWRVDDSASGSRVAAICGDCVPVEGFVAVARPAADEIAIVFARGSIAIAAAEARQLVATMTAALAILDGAHAAQGVPVGQFQGAV